MKRFILIVVCLFVIALPAGALSVDEVLEEQKEELDLDGLEREAKQYTDGMNLRMEYDWEDNLSNLIETGTDELFGVSKKAVRSCVIMVVIVLFCSLSEGMLEGSGGLQSSAVKLAGTLAISTVAVADVHSLLGLGVSSVESIAAFSNTLLPIVAALTAATGAITGAYARQMAAALFSSVLINLINSVLVPLVYGYAVVNIAHAATGNTGLKRIAGIFKWAVVTLLTGILLTYVGYLTLSGVVSGSADAATIKAAKFAISSAVPVVGGILADASESVLAASGILRGSVGVFGMIAVLGICLIPFLRLAVHYLAYKAAAAMSAAIGENPISGLIESLSSTFGMILGMMGACALMLLISLVSSVIVVTA